MGFWYAGTRWLPLLRAAGKAVDLVVANSHAAGRAACERERLPSSKLRIIYNGLVSLPRRPAASAGPDIGSGPSGGRVGIVANARPVKRVEDLVRAFTRVRAGGRDCDLAIVGRVTPSVAALVNASSLREQVHMPGQVEDAIAWIRTFDVGVICSESEGLSNALLEYMQCGVAVVATATGGNVELVEHEQTGLLVAVADTDGLAAALERLLADEPLRRRLGEAGRAFVASRFSITEMVDAHEGLYRTLSGSPDRLAASHNA
jgi:glycosyltransferase involved in cell wall biosynthesis